MLFAMSWLPLVLNCNVEMQLPNRAFPRPRLPTKRQNIGGNRNLYILDASQTIKLVARMIRRVQHRMTLFRFVDEFIIVRRMMERLNRIIIYGFFMVVFTISTVYAF